MNKENRLTPTKEGIKSALKKQTTVQLLVISGIMILMVVVLSLLSDRFLTKTNLSNVSRQVALVIIAGCPVTLLMIAGYLDLSVGGVQAFTCVVFAQLCAMGLPLPLAVVITMVLGGLVGLCNGFFVEVLKVVPVVATMGTMYITQGLAFLVCGGNSVNQGLPYNFDFLSRGKVFGIQFPILMVIVVTVLFIFVQKKTLLGKYAYAIGGNKEASVLSGINTKLISTALFTIGGCFAGLTGSMLSSRLGTGSPNVASGFEFDVIIAIVLGGTSPNGGSGAVINTIIGAFIVGFLSNGLNLLGVQSFYQSVLKGVILVAAIVLDRTIRQKIMKVA